MNKKYEDIKEGYFIMAWYALKAVEKGIIPDTNITTVLRNEDMLLSCIKNGELGHPSTHEKIKLDRDKTF